MDVADADSWIRDDTPIFPADFFAAGEEFVFTDDDSVSEFMCPFCDRDFDMVGFCGHLDEDHTTEINNGICPLCSKREDIDLAGHITIKHSSLLRVQPPRAENDDRFDYGNDEMNDNRSNINMNDLDPNLALLMEELERANLPFSRDRPSSSPDHSHLLSSFVFDNPQLNDDEDGKVAVKGEDAHLAINHDREGYEDGSDFEFGDSEEEESKNAVEGTSKGRIKRSYQEPEKDREEKANKAAERAKRDEMRAKQAEFIQEILMSTFLR